jgi:hypothetical protein
MVSVLRRLCSLLWQSLRWLLSRAWDAQADVYLLLFAVGFHDERGAGGVVEPVATGVGQPFAGSCLWAVRHDDSLVRR